MIEISFSSVAKFKERWAGALLTRKSLRAQGESYNAIRFPSERGEGANIAILDKFDFVLSPKMIMPVPAEEIPKISTTNITLRKSL